MSEEPRSGQGRFPASFWLLSVSSMLAGGYAIMLLSLTLMYGNDSGYSSAAAGFLSSVFAFSSLGARPFTGLWCDRRSKRALLILAAAGFAVTPVGFLLHAPYGVLVAVRIVQGICLSVATTAAGALATELIPRGRFTEGIGYYGIGMAASSAIAPGVGLWLHSSFGYLGVFLFSSILGVAVIALTLPVAVPAARREQGTVRARGSFLREMVEPTALFATAVTLVLSVAQVTVMQFLSYFTGEWGMSGTGLFYPVSAVAVIGLRAGAGQLRRWASERRILFAGFLLLIAAYGGLSLFHPSAVLLAALALFYGLGHSMSGMVLNSMAVADAPPERVGAANATYLSASDLGYALGPILWNVYCAQSGYRSMFAIAAVLVTAMLLVVCANFSIKKRETETGK
ncbi:MFS transporter [Feifania hominis]|uniref:MFS transporter n=1 Tax=Feifania hominis TaxID=2763660 RepID=A0A926DC46_9FIRM|nr:MFS transporter [Feifania hominis]MBC8535838.1 MFS transporter [Feifania hominis]